VVAGGFQGAARHPADGRRKDALEGELPGCCCQSGWRGLRQNLSVEEACRLSRENAKDIIACGFDPKRTFIFSDFGAAEF